jgi:hypothetical protein
MSINSSQSESPTPPPAYSVPPRTAQYLEVVVRLRSPWSSHCGAIWTAADLRFHGPQPLLIHVTTYLVQYQQGLPRSRRRLSRQGFQSPP